MQWPPLYLHCPTKQTARKRQTKVKKVNAFLLIFVSILSFAAGILAAGTGPDFVEVCTDRERVLVEVNKGSELRYIDGSCFEWTLIDVASAEIADVTTYTRTN